MVKEMIGGCCVCSDERGWEENPLVYCDGHGCNVAVHKACYGIVHVPKGPWFCRKCESQERIARVKCELCPYKEGALKRTDTGGWAHVVCALYIPEVRFGNVTTMEPIILASVPHDRFCKTCYICEERGRESKTAHGACMNCNKTGCRHAFHVTCAQSSGLLCEENDGQSGPTVKYVGYCQFHWNKKAKGILFNTKPTDKPGKITDKEKEKDNKEKEKVDKEKEKEKEKPKNKTDKEKEKKPPKPRLSTGAAAASTEQSTRPENGASGSSSQPSTPKQRGRKPSTVKASTESPDAKTTPETQKPASISSGSPRQSPLPGLVQLPTEPVQIDSAGPVLSTKDGPVLSTKDMTSPRAMSSSVLVPEMIPKTVTTHLQEISRTATNVLFPEITKPMDVIMSPVTSTPKQTPKQPAASSVPKQPVASSVPKQPVASSVPKQPPASSVPKKRPANKGGDEPKRKVGRPPLKSKANASTGDHKNNVRTSAANLVTSPLNTAFPSTFPQDSQGTSTAMPSYPSFSSPGMFSGSNQGTSVPQNGPRTPSPNPYMIPQPRNRGLLENGHVQRPNNVNPGPLQLPTSLEELLEYQWDQGAQFLMQQASQYDVASLMSSLHQLKADNTRLEERLASLTNRKNQLLQVNARLATPMSCTSTNLTVTPSVVSQSTPTSSRAATAASQGSLSTETKTTQSLEGPRGTIKAGADGAPKLKVSQSSDGGKVPLVSEGKAPMSANVKPGSITGGEQRMVNGGVVKDNKTKEPQVKRPETSFSSVQGISSSSPSPTLQKQSLNVGSLVLQQPKTNSPQQIQQEKQFKPTHVNATLQPIMVSSLATSKPAQQQQQQHQQPQLQPRFQQQKIILPQPSPTSVAFSQPQQTPSQQHVLLQLIKQQEDHHRLPNQATFGLDKQQLGTQQAQAAKLLPTTGPNQGHSLSLSYPGFLTFTDQMALSGARVDMMKATHLAPLSMVSLDGSQAGTKDRAQYFDLDKSSNSLEKTSRNG